MADFTERPFSQVRKEKYKMVKSMYAAVAGLRTHQAKMDVIGNNIANVNTFAFKKARASFRDQFYATMRGSSEADNVYGGGNPSQVGYGTSLSSIEIDHGTASGAPTGNGMDVMIDGNGFFLVGKFSESGYGTISNVAGLNLTSLFFTRVGIFNLDGQGYLVDSLKNHVFGFGENSKLTSVVTTPSTSVVQRLEALQAPWCMYDSATGKPIIHDSTSAAAASTEFNTAHADEITAGFIKSTTMEDFLGKAVQVTWLMKGTPPAPLQYDLDDRGYKQPVYPATMPARPGGGTYVMPPAADANVYAATMKLTNITIGSDGTMVGVNQDTEEIVTMGQIQIADVPNPNALENTSNGYFKAKKNTGVITAEIPGHGSTGSLNPGRLEMANVDLAQEFTDMITTQRGFQANGRIITVTDEMLAELVNLKR